MNNDGKPRDYTPYGHKKFITQNRVKVYASLVSYGIPARLRVLRRANKRASGADAYAARACAVYKSIFGSAQTEHRGVDFVLHSGDGANG